MAIKFRLVEVGVDAGYNVTVNGYYVDGANRVSEDKVFNFDPTAVSPAGMKEIVSKAQPIPDPELEARKAAAQTAIAKISSLVGTDVTLNAPVTEG
jgi:hypothetical protein